tara:strand:- start:733 stop:2451 length:1719 start_codon:yes stop_codon:yes gene_type:complete
MKKKFNILRSVDLSIKYLKIFRKYITGQRLPNWKEINKKKGKRKEQKNERVLIAVSTGGLESHLVFESMIGSILNYEGYEVDYLLCDELLPACIMATINRIDEVEFNKHGSKKICSYCFVRSNNYLKQTGGNVLRFSEFISSDEYNQIKKKEYSHLSFEEIKNFKLDEIAIGEHANSGAIRYFASSDYENMKNSKSILLKYLKSSIVTKKVCENLFTKNRYKEVFINHGIYVPQGVILDTAKKFNIMTSTWSPGYRRNSAIITRGDTYHRTLIYEDNSKWENFNFSKTEEKKIDKYLKSRWYGKTDWEFYFNNPKFEIEEYFTKKGIDLNKPIIGLATNMLWDAQVYFPTNFFSGMLEWLFFTIDFFIKNPNLQLVIRVHPAETHPTKKSVQRVEKDIIKKYGKLPKNILIIKPDDNISTYSVFEKCNGVIVYASKIGIETSATNIPTIICGESFVRNKKVTFDPSSKEEYLEILKKIPFSKNTISRNKLLRAKKYAYHFWFRKTMEYKSLVENDLKKGIFMEIKKDLFDIYKQKQDPALEETIRSIINGGDFILKDENLKNEEFNEAKFLK